MTTTFVCPKGDQSDDPEFCSVCGIKIETATLPVPAGDRCPSCGAEHTPGARFCETCRYDFKSQAAGLPPSPDPVQVAVANPVTAAVADPPSPSPAPPTTSTRYWEAVVTVDPSLDVEPDPDSPCPNDSPERTFPLDLSENLVGRRSSSRGIFPQVPLDDPGVSHRHVMIYRNADASLSVSDLGSTNGTFLNGSADRLEAGVKTPVTEDDRVELGRWTRITFRQHT